MNRILCIHPSDRNAAAAAKAQWDSIAKPLGSFGLLEEMVQKIAAMQGTADVDISRRTAVVLCGDHGVVSEGVTQTGSDVTAVCAEAIAAGRSNVNALAAAYGVEVLCADLGMVQEVRHPAILNRKIAPGTRNFTQGAAMTIAETEQAICAGMDIVCDLKQNGVQLVLTGEMGIGNTTAASALASVLLGKSPRKVTGRGAGLSDAGLERKIHAVERAISVNQPDPKQPLALLAKLGGLEIAGMVGLFLGGAYYRMPVVIDGVISAAAAAIAYELNPICTEFMLPSHASGEPAGEGLLTLMGLQPVIRAGLRLGEGTGGLLLLPLLDGALALYRNAHRFDETPIERYQPLC